MQRPRWRPNSSTMSLLQITLASLPTVVATASTVVNVRLKRTARAEGKAHAEFLRLLKGATVAGNRSLSFPAAARSVLDDVAEVTQWPVAHVFVRGEDPGELVSTGVWRVPAGWRCERLVAVTDGAPSRPDGDAAGLALTSRRPACVPDIATESHIPRYRAAQVAGLKSALAIPLLLGYEVAGVIEFFSDQKGAPDEASIEVLVNVTDQLGRMLERDWADEDLDASDEHVGELEGTVEEMTQRLRRSEGQLRQSKKQLGDVKKQLRQLEEQVGEAQAAVHRSAEQLRDADDQRREADDRRREADDQLRQAKGQLREMAERLRGAEEQLRQADEQRSGHPHSWRLGRVLPLAVNGRTPDMPDSAPQDRVDGTVAGAIGGGHDAARDAGEPAVEVGEDLHVMPSELAG